VDPAPHWLLERVGAKQWHHHPYGVLSDVRIHPDIESIVKNHVVESLVEFEAVIQELARSGRKFFSGDVFNRVIVRSSQ
jgi:hypothetical protein